MYPIGKNAIEKLFRILANATLDNFEELLDFGDFPYIDYLMVTKMITFYLNNHIKYCNSI